MTSYAIPHVLAANPADRYAAQLDLARVEINRLVRERNEALVSLCDLIDHTKEHECRSGDPSVAWVESVHTAAKLGFIDGSDYPDAYRTGGLR